MELKFKCQLSIVTNFGTFNSVPLEVTKEEFEQKKINIQKWAAGVFDPSKYPLISVTDKISSVPVISMQLEDGSFLAANTALLTNAVAIIKKI